MRKPGLVTYTKILTGVLLFSPVILSCNRSPKSPPNLLIVFPDQLRESALGFIGKEPAITPNIDRFAGESLVLTNAISNYPISSPFRAMLLTGKYPLSNGVVDNCWSVSSKYNVELRESDTTWSDVLKSQDYSLGYIGKWHLEAPYEPYIDCYNNKGGVAWNEWTPPNRRHGFSFWYAYNTYDQHNHPLYWSTNASRDEFGYINKWGPEHEADMAIKFIKNEDGKYREKGKPWALVVSMNPPHMPYDQVPEKYVRRYDSLPDSKLYASPNIPPVDSAWGKYNRKNARNQYAMITGIDECFGRIVGALKEAGYDKNTIVVFTSDHGDCLGRHNQISKNNPFEESIVIPFIIRWPGTIKPGKDDILLSVPDIYPTLLSIMGLKKMIPKSVEGSDFSKIFLTGEGQKPTSQLYMLIPRDNLSGGNRGVRTDRYTMIINKDTDNSDMVFLGDDNVFLYDNLHDPYQLKNIAEKEIMTVDSLKEELNKWLLLTKDSWKY